MVALGVAAPDDGRLWVASGFHYFHRVADEDGETRYQPFLVTNRHVIEHEGPSLYVRVNPLVTGAAREYEMQAGAPSWTAHSHPGIDVAVARVNVDLMRSEGLDVCFLQSDTDCASVAVMAETGVTEGDFVYVLGFPMGPVGAERDTVLARSGSLVRVRDLLGGAVNSFILDASVFPGNSGGPVVLKPEALSITGTAAVTTAYVIGIVAGFLHFPDVAVSQQSGRRRVVFEENSGLAIAFPMDAVFATANHALGLIPEADRSQEAPQPPDQPA